MYKESRWAREILALQSDDGLFGGFHSLSRTSRSPITTEQALRRLSILGFTIEDAPIQKTVSYLSDCLAGKRQMPDRREKSHDWDLFSGLMFATWVRRFTRADERANAVAMKWAGVITGAFAGGAYDASRYAEAYRDAFGAPPKGGRFADFVSFYQVSLISDLLDEGTEGAVVAYILRHEPGIYYVCDCLSELPAEFASRRASRYLGAMELLSAYRRSTEKLAFVAQWLNENRNENGRWDMGSIVKDHMYFPLSDSWRSRRDRENDCTYRIEALLRSLFFNNV